MRHMLALAIVLAGLAAAPAAAHAPPQIYLRQLDVSNRPTGSWISLPGAHIASVNGYELGVRLETSGEHVLVELTSEPSPGLPQKEIYDLCFAQTGARGTIRDLDERIHYAGNGGYGVKVTVSDAPDASTGCTTANAASSTGTFTVHGSISIRRIGARPLVIDPLLRHPPPPAGWRIDAPPLSSFPDVMCFRDARRKPDGSLTGKDPTPVTADRSRRVPAGAFYADAADLRDAGTWTCQAEVANGSALTKPPIAVTRPEFVRMRWYGLDHLALPDFGAPVFTLRGDTPEGAGGGRVTLRLTRRICGGKPRRGPTVHARVSRRTGKVSLRFRLPRLKRSEGAALYTATTTISGARAMVGRRVDLGPSLELTRDRHHRQVLEGSIADCA